MVSLHNDISKQYLRIEHYEIRKSECIISPFKNRRLEIQGNHYDVCMNQISSTSLRNFLYGMAIRLLD